MSEIQSEETMEWTEQVVAAAYSSESVRVRMRAAGAVAFALARMRHEKQNSGFMPLPFGDYLRGLANLAEVALGPVLKWAGVCDPGALSPTEAQGAGRLAQALGFRLEELIIALRISVAERAGGAPLPLLAARRGGSGIVTAAECDGILRRLEMDWSADVSRAADALVEGAIAAYRSRSQEE